MSLVAYAEWSAGFESNSRFRIELHKVGFTGSAREIFAVGRFSDHNYQSANIREPHKTPILKSDFTLEFRVEDNTDLDLLKDIYQSNPGEYYIIKKVNNVAQWQGDVDVSRIDYKRSPFPFHGKIHAKDIDVLDGFDYLQSGELPTGRKKIIQIIADILPYELPIHTYTSWKEGDLLESQDYLDNLYLSTQALRRFGGRGEPDEAISKLKALEEVLRANALILFQSGQVWKIFHISALQNADNIRQYVYNSDGILQTSVLTDITTSLENGYVLRSSSFQGIKSYKSARVRFDHRTTVTNINPPEVFTFEMNEQESYSQFFVGDGGQRLSIGFNISARVPDENTSAISRYRVRVGDFYLQPDGSWLDSATIIENDLSFFGTFTGEKEFIGFEVLTSQPIPTQATGVLEITYLSVDGDLSTANATNYGGVSFDIINSSIESGNNTALDYKLTQSVNRTDRYDHGSIWFGDGPIDYSLAPFTRNEAGTSLTNNWKLGNKSDMIHGNIVLKEIMDLQRRDSQGLYLDLWAVYQPHEIISIDSNLYFFLGGSQTGKDGKWRANVFLVNVQESTTDLFEEIYRTGGDPATGSESPGGGGGGSPVSWGTLSGKPFSTIGDDLEVVSNALRVIPGTYFKVSDDLSEGDPATMRSNLGLGATDDVTFKDVTGSGVLRGESFRNNSGVIKSAANVRFEQIDATTLRNVSVGNAAANEHALNRQTADNLYRRAGTGAEQIRSNTQLDARFARLALDNTFTGVNTFEKRVRIINSNFRDHLRLERTGNPTVDISPASLRFGGVSITLEETFGFQAGRIMWYKTHEDKNEFSLSPNTSNTIGDLGEEFDGNRWRSLFFDGQIKSGNFAEAGGLITGLRYNEGLFQVQNMQANELRVKAFIAEISQAISGEDFLTRAVTNLSRNFTVPAVGSSQRVFVDDMPGFAGFQNFVNGNFGRMRVVDASSGLQVFDVWGTFSSYIDEEDGEQSWLFTRIAGGLATTGDVVQAGSVILDYGTSGSGIIRRSAIDEPFDTIETWETSPVSAGNYTVRDRRGFLGGVATPEFGTLPNVYGTYMGVGFIGGDVEIAGNLRVSSLPVISDEGLVLHAKFDDGVGTNFLNSSTIEGKKNGTLTGGTSYVSGISGLAVYNDGSSAGGAFINSYAGASFNDNDNFTIEAWFKWDGGSVDASATIITKGVRANSVGLQINSGFVQAGVRGSSGGAILTSGYTLDHNVAHHALMTYNGASNRIRLYINGVFFSESQEYTGGSFSTSSDWRIAAHSGIAGSGANFEGWVDEARVWDRILTDNEIKGRYSSPSGSNGGFITANTVRSGVLESLNYAESGGVATAGTRWNLNTGKLDASTFDLATGDSDGSTRFNSATQRLDFFRGGINSDILASLNTGTSFVNRNGELLTSSFGTFTSNLGGTGSVSTIPPAPFCEPQVRYPIRTRVNNTSILIKHSERYRVEIPMRWTNRYYVNGDSACGVEELNFRNRRVRVRVEVQRSSTTWELIEDRLIMVTGSWDDYVLRYINNDNDITGIRVQFQGHHLVQSGVPPGIDVGDFESGLVEVYREVPITEVNNAGLNVQFTSDKFFRVDANGTTIGDQLIMENQTFIDGKLFVIINGQSRVIQTAAP